MSTNTLTSIKLSTPLVDAARTDAALFHRSIGGQVEHWAKLGRAMESAPGFTTERIRAALAGEYDAMLLSGDETVIFDDLLGEAMGSVMTPADVPLGHVRRRAEHRFVNRRPIFHVIAGPNGKSTLYRTAIEPRFQRRSSSMPTCLRKRTTARLQPRAKKPKPGNDSPKNAGEH
jgi:hypothetical protein